MRYLVIGCMGASLCLVSLACSNSSPTRLSSQQSDDLIASMIEKLEEPDPRGKIIAAMFLGGQGKKAEPAIPALQKLAKESNPGVQQAAEAALARIEGRSESVD